MSRDEQPTFASVGFDIYRRPTRKHEFLRRMNRVIPWEELAKEVQPYYPKKEGLGRPAKPLIWMLKLYFLQLWYGLSDPATEDQMYDSHAVQEFLGLDLGKDWPPDETTICKFRHLLERHRLGEGLFERVKEIHSVEVTAANVHDSQVVEKLLHGKEEEVYGDRAYIGQEEKIRARVPKAKIRIERRAVRGHPLSEKQKEKNRRWARIRCRVEHVFGWAKVRF